MLPYSVLLIKKRLCRAEKFLGILTSLPKQQGQNQIKHL